MKKITKVLLCALLVAIMAFPTACGGGKTSTGGGTSGGQSSTTPPPALAELTINETIQKLSVNEYTDASLKDDGFYGLSDISDVGVYESELETELYPIDDTDCEIINLAESTETDGFEMLNQAFIQAKQLNEAGKKVVIDLPANEVITVHTGKGGNTYTFNLFDYNGLYVRGNGAKIELTYDQFAYRGFVYLERCKDVHFQGFSVDYAIPTAINGVITAIDTTNYTTTIKIDKRFNESVKRIIGADARLYSYVEFDSITLAPKQGGNFCTSSEGFITGYTCSGSDDEGYTFVVSFGSPYYGYFSDVSLGDYANLAFSMYVYNGFGIYSCEDVYMEDVTIHSIGGMAVVGNKTTNIYCNRVNIALPEDSGRLMTATADGFHFAECYGEVEITNSIIEYTHDDALNIKSGYYYELTSVDVRGKQVVISRKTESISTPDVGNVIEFYDAATFEKLGSGTVESVTGNEATFTIVVEESLSKQNAGSWLNGRDVVATNISKTAKFLFENNIVRNKRNRGLLIQVRDALVKNNAFMNVGHGSISIHSSLDVFNEATMPQNVSVVNNKFINNNYLLSLSGDISVFARTASLAPVGTITGIEIANNFIARNGNAGISLQSCGDSTIKNNLLYNNGRVTANEVYECAVEMNNSANIVIEGNYAYNTNNSPKWAGIIPNGLTSPETITLKNNINLNYQVIESEVATTEVGKLGTDITVDGNIADWINQGTEIAMVGHSLATGVAIDPIEYNDVFGVEMCKIGWTDKGIYIAFKVRDNLYDFKTQNNFWNGDCFELFVSNVIDMPNADFQLSRNKGDVIQVGATPTWAPKNWTMVESRTNDNILANKDLFKTVCVKDADGYAGEVFMPFELFGGIKTSVENGEEIAIALVFADNDRDDIGRKRLQVSNVPHFVEVWKTKTAKMPRFKFV